MISLGGAAGATRPRSPIRRLALLGLAYVKPQGAFGLVIETLLSRRLAAILAVNGIAADAPTTLPNRLPTVLHVARGTVTVAGVWRRRSRVLT